MPSSLLGVVPHGQYLVQYNGFTFEPAATYTDGINCTPIPDSSGRTFKAVKAQLALVSRVFLPPPTTIDNTMEALEQRLMSKGGALYYREKGFGDFTVNVPGGRKKDIAWGPTPTHFRAKPLADAYCWQIEWGVEATYPWCDAARFENDLVEWNYKVYYDYDDGGYETRRILGHIEIPLTRSNQGDRLIRQTADDYRDVVAPRCPPWFRPMTSYFELSEDRRTLTFNFQFAQIPGPVPPPGILKVELAEGLQNAEPLNFNKWTWTVDANYEMVAGFPHSTAFGHFVRTCQTLLDAMQKEIVANKVNAPAAQENHQAGAIPGWVGKVAPFLLPPPIGAALIVRDQLKGIAKDIKDGVAEGIRDAFGIKKRPAQQQNGLVFLPLTFQSKNPNRYDKPRAQFSCSYSIVGTARTWLAAGLWTPLREDNDYTAWRKSVDLAFGPRGQLGSHFDPSDDVIIDLCRPGISKLKAIKPPTIPDRIVVHVPTPSGGPIPVKLSGEANWIDLKNDLQLLQEDSVLISKPLPRDATLKSRGSRGGTSRLRTPAFTGAAGIMAPYIPQGVRDFASTIINTVASTYSVLMTGYGVRVGVPPTPYGLISVGGMPAIPANQPKMGDGIRTTTIGNVSVPVYVTYWQLRYLLPAAPGDDPKDPQSGASLPNPGGDNGQSFGTSSATPRAVGIVGGNLPRPSRGLTRY